MFVEEEGQTEDPPILTGDTLEGAQFAVSETRRATGGGTSSTSRRSRERRERRHPPGGNRGIERVKSQISSAGLMELTTSAFRLYEDRDGTWQWTLAREDGSVVGTCSREFDQRDDAEESVSLKDRGPDADVIEIEGAAFTYVEERDRWYWRLIDDERTPLATGETGHRSQERAEDAARTFAQRFERARVLDVDGVGAELYERNDTWSWRLVDSEDDVLATASRSSTPDATRRRPSRRFCRSLVRPRSPSRASRNTNCTRRANSGSSGSSTRPNASSPGTPMHSRSTPRRSGEPNSSPTGHTLRMSSRSRTRSTRSILPTAVRS